MKTYSDTFISLSLFLRKLHFITLDWSYWRVLWLSLKRADLDLHCIHIFRILIKKVHFLRINVKVQVVYSFLVRSTSMPVCRNIWPWHRVESLKSVCMEPVFHCHFRCKARMEIIGTHLGKAYSLHAKNFPISLR